MSNAALSGYTSEPEIAMGNESSRLAIYDPSGTYVGTIVYVARKVKAGGTQYGWRPDKNPRATLTDQVDAIKRLPRVGGA